MHACVCEGTYVRRECEDGGNVDAVLDWRVAAAAGGAGTADGGAGTVDTERRAARPSRPGGATERRGARRTGARRRTTARRGGAARADGGRGARSPGGDGLARAAAPRRGSEERRVGKEC